MTKLDKEQKMIGLFMGFVLEPDEPEYKMRIPHFIQSEPTIETNPMVCERDYCEWAESYQDGATGGGYSLSFHRLEFNSNWSWLMCVVDKIGELGYNITISRSYSTLQVTSDSKLGFFETCKGHSGRGGNRTKIEATYLIVVEFIKWYNKKYKK